MKSDQCIGRPGVVTGFRSAKLFLLTTFVLLLGASCKKSKSGPLTETPLQHIVADGTRLSDESGNTFRAWGLNYGAGGGGLTESFWTSESRWEELAKDWKDMKGLGANVVRVHLQAHEFLLDTETVNTAAIDNLKRLTNLSEEVGIYLLITGLGAYIEADQPPWYTELGDEERWAAHTTFWKEIAKAVGQSPAVLGYDLMNEPIVAVRPEGGWTPGEPYGGFNYVQNIALATNGKTQMEVLGEWIDRLTEAIREYDTRHLVTAGFLSFPVYSTMEPHLSGMTVHLYPHEDDVGPSDKAIGDFSSDRIPLMVTEISSLNGSPDFIADFIRRHNDRVSGWMWHYHGETPEEIGEPETIVEALWKIALEKFREMAPGQK